MHLSAENRYLAADVPDRETDVFVFDGFDIEADSGDGGDNLSQLQFVQDGSLSRSIQSHWKFIND